MLERCRDRRIVTAHTRGKRTNGGDRAGLGCLQPGVERSLITGTHHVAKGRDSPECRPYRRALRQEPVTEGALLCVECVERA